MQIGDRKVVQIDYTLTDGQGQVLDSSKGREPLTYLHGSGGIIPGLESALDGKSAGDNVKTEVPPDRAYGRKDPAQVQQVPRAAFRGVDKIEPGMQFQANSPQGPRIVTVIAATDEQVTIDANHPLAGQTLHFDVTVVSVRDATAEEIEHGHAHGAGGHHHH